jgi:hypothetical protein
VETSLREVEAARSRNDPDGLVKALIAHAQALLTARKAGAAVSPLGEAVSVANAAGLTSAAATAFGVRARALFVLGRLDEAQDSAIESLRRAERANAPKRPRGAQGRRASRHARSTSRGTSSRCSERIPRP